MNLLKLLADHVLQEMMGYKDLEFVWASEALGEGAVKAISEFSAGMRIVQTNETGDVVRYTVSGVRFGTVYVIPTDRYGSVTADLYEIELPADKWGSCAVEV